MTYLDFKEPDSTAASAVDLRQQQIGDLPVPLEDLRNLLMRPYWTYQI